MCCGLCYIEGQLYVLWGLGTIISRKKLPFVDITHILYSVDSHARRGHIASHTRL